MAESSDLSRDYKTETLRGAAGFFRVGQAQTGSWSLINPAGQPFFATAVNEVQRLEISSLDPVPRLRRWGFNTLGAGSSMELRDEGLAWIAAANFSATSPLIHASGIRLPDVFDLSWPASTLHHAELACGALAGRPDLLGWLTDDDLGWGCPGGGERPSLLQTCLSLEPGFAAYHAAWEFVLAPHRGRLPGLAKAWAHPIENKEVVRELTRSDRTLTSRGYLKDNARWTREFAQRYFSATLAALRTFDPNHLILGLGHTVSLRGAAHHPLPGVVVETMVNGVDLPWIPLQEFSRHSDRAVFISDFNSVTPEFLEGRGLRVPGTTSVERMLRKSRAALRRLVVHPAVVGYAWRRWMDLPGEQPPFASGLIHLNDAEAREHTELVADINRRINTLRSSSSFPLQL
jgi:hypothetical protein